MAEAYRDQLMASVKRLYASGEYSDLNITCGNDSYKVHKAVVFPRAALASVMATDGTIDLPEDEPYIIKLLIQYLYEAEYDPLIRDDSFIVLKTETRSPYYWAAYSYEFPHTCASIESYSDKGVVCPHHTCDEQCRSNYQGFICEKCTQPTMNGPPEQLLTHAKMYEVADKYDVVGLKDLSKEKFRRACAGFWNHASFPLAAHHALSTTPDHDKGLRDIISTTIGQHLELIIKPEIKALLWEFNGLAFEVIMQKWAQGRR